MCLVTKKHCNLMWESSLYTRRYDKNTDDNTKFDTALTELTQYFSNIIAYFNSVFPVQRSKIPLTIGY